LAPQLERERDRDRIASTHHAREQDAKTAAQGRKRDRFLGETAETIVRPQSRPNASRVADAKAAEDAETERREKNKKHVGSINRGRPWKR